MSESNLGHVNAAITGKYLLSTDDLQSPKEDLVQYGNLLVDNFLGLAERDMYGQG